MEVKVLWTDFALSQLESIYDYYKYKASTRVAKKLVRLIVETSISLQTNPLIGIKEPLLSERVYEYRGLIVKKYKIIYRFVDNRVIIVSVFDCRQNPKAIENIND